MSKFAPPWVKNASWRVEGNSTVVEFETDSDSGYHDFKDGSHVVLDILAPKTDGAAYTPPGIAKPAVSKMEAGAKTGVTTAQAQAIAQTAAKLQPAQPEKKPDAKPAETKK